MVRRFLASIALLGLCSGGAVARDVRVPAEPGRAQTLFESGQVQPGDRVILENGRHGSLTIAGQRYRPPVVVAADAGARPIVDQLTIDKVAGLHVQGLTILPMPGMRGKDALVRVQSDGDVHLERLTVASAQTQVGWSRRIWRETARNGVSLGGRDVALTNSFIRIVGHAIVAAADGARVENNFVELFAGDGIRGLGDDSVYRGNTVETCVDVDDNHDDGFQSWSRGKDGKAGSGVVRNVAVENNVIRNGNHPFACKLQGIGLFDGIYEDWTIRNNTVVVDHWHGITVMGARRVSVIGNTVVDARPGNPGPPWISVTAHKDGRPAIGSVVAGNRVERRTVGGDGDFRLPQPGVQVSGNRTGWRP